MKLHEQILPLQGELKKAGITWLQFTMLRSIAKTPGKDTMHHIAATHSSYHTVWSSCEILRKRGWVMLDKTSSKPRAKSKPRRTFSLTPEGLARTTEIFRNLTPRP